MLISVEQYTAPDPKEFFAVSANKAKTSWASSMRNGVIMSNWSLLLAQLLGGGFKEESKSMVRTEGSVTDVPALKSTQQEADTRIYSTPSTAFRMKEWTELSYLSDLPEL